MIAGILTRALGGPKASNPLAHISAADLGEAVALYRLDDDQAGFLLHVRAEMLAAGMTDDETRARLVAFVALVRQRAN